MPGHYTNTSSIVANSSIVASTLRGLIDDLDDAIYDVDTQNVLAMPTGSISAYAGISEPVGWLLCYGQAVSRSSYAALFAIISTQYGVGDGSSTFNLPDLRGRTIIAMDNMGGAAAGRITGGLADTLGETGGAQTHTLQTTEIPSHSHTITPNAVTASGGGLSTTGGGSNWGQGALSAANAGGGGAHNNMQPYISLNYIIKT